MRNNSISLLCILSVVTSLAHDPACSHDFLLCLFFVSCAAAFAPWLGLMGQIGGEDAEDVSPGT